VSATDNSRLKPKKPDGTGLLMFGMPPVSSWTTFLPPEGGFGTGGGMRVVLSKAAGVVTEGRGAEADPVGV